MIITLRGDRTRQHKQLSQYNLGSEIKRRATRRRFLSIIHDHLIGPYLLPDHLDVQKYLTFLQEVLCDLPRNELSLGKRKGAIYETSIESSEECVARISFADVREMPGIFQRQRVLD
ncbi:hypothetical protein AVEN_267144-1 [Araneus ventricosus]|uniref:Uncharacterized protein n=1 Tax=Araneus ventricosus TaxID=182803 RepID=A0A4Y2GF00_ARAVE|nr:hypothetical protein AVEN_267144-1 [Araneus ventricosus]